MDGATPRSSRYARAERRIGHLTLALGLSAAAVVAATVSLPAGAGVAAGAALAWINYRWLAGGVSAITRQAVAQAGPALRGPRISFWVYVRFFARYALLALAAYAMVRVFRVPIWSVLAGLFALGAAAMAEGLYEVFAQPDSASH